MRIAFPTIAIMTLSLTVPIRVAAAPPSDEHPPEIQTLLMQVEKLGGSEAYQGPGEHEFIEIRFRKFGFDDDDLTTLRPFLLACKSPVSLDLTAYIEISDAGFASLRDIPALARLVSTSPRITDEGLKHLAGLTNLKELELASDGITDAGIAHLGKLTKLRVVNVHSDEVTDAAAVHLTQLVNLENLLLGNIIEPVGEAALEHLVGMTKLQAVNVGGREFGDIGMEHLAKLTGLRKLQLWGPKVTAAGLARLAALEHLQVLEIKSCGGCTGDGLAPLAKLKELESLDLVDVDALDRVGAGHLGRIKRLKKLRLDDFERSALAGLAGHAALESLFLFNRRVSDVDMQYVGKLPALQVLSVAETEITDEGIKHLTGLTNLRRLSAGQNELTDATLEYLAEIPSLEDVALPNCQISGTGFKQLAKLTKLRKLQLDGTRVSDEYLSALKDLTNLQWLGLRKTVTTEQAALDLKRARPELNVADFSGEYVKLPDEPAKPKAVPTVDVAQIEPAFKLTAQAFHDQYKLDRKGTVAKLQGKVIELSGTVDLVMQGTDGPTVNFKVEGDAVGVVCTTADERPWAKVVPGQQIKLKGLWPAGTSYPSLVGCVFVYTGEYGALRTTAAELARDYGADPVATIAKQEDRYVAVTGNVIAIKFGGIGAELELQTDRNVKVFCTFSSDFRRNVKQLKIGQTLSTVGEFFTFKGESDVTIHACLPLSGF